METNLLGSKYISELTPTDLQNFLLTCSAITSNSHRLDQLVRSPVTAHNRWGEKGGKRRKEKQEKTHKIILQLAHFGRGCIFQLDAGRLKQVILCIHTDGNFFKFAIMEDFKMAPATKMCQLPRKIRCVQ